MFPFLPRHNMAFGLMFPAFIVAGELEAAPYALDNGSQLRNDFSISWAGFSTAHDAGVPDGTLFTASNGGAGVR